MDAIDQLEELRNLNERIICTATFDARCRACQSRNDVYIQIPVSKDFYEDFTARESFLDSRFVEYVGPVIEASDSCPVCNGKDFEIGKMTRHPSYRDGDPMRWPVDVP